MLEEDSKFTCKNSLKISAGWLIITLCLNKIYCALEMSQIKASAFLVEFPDALFLDSLIWRLLQCVHTNMAKYLILHVNISVFCNSNIGYCRALQHIINAARLPSGGQSQHRLLEISNQFDHIPS